MRPQTESSPNTLPFAQLPLYLTSLSNSNELFNGPLSRIAWVSRHWKADGRNMCHDATPSTTSGDNSGKAAHLGLDQRHISCLFKAKW